jgi:SET domain-containing protein
MFLILTHVGPSKIHGTGCFTSVDIHKGDIIWEFHPGLDTIISEEDFSRQPPAIQQYLRWYAYMNLKPRHWVLCGDHARFMNHQDQPNIREHKDGSGRSVAQADIPAGSELTCDYGEFDADSKAKLSNGGRIF